jgi:hypothetical protein
VFDPGPIFANAVVMDEINRATPRLQSAMFEAMDERFVTVGKTRHPLPRPFFLVATMNPYEGEGELYRLPHGQRDRFSVCTRLGYPSADGEIDLLDASAAPTRSPTSTRSSRRATSSGSSAAPPSSRCRRPSAPTSWRSCAARAPTPTWRSARAPARPCRCSAAARLWRCSTTHRPSTRPRA